MEKSKMNYQEINAKTIDKWVEEGWEWGKPITSEIYQSARKGDWGVYLTPTKIMPHNWFPNSIENLKVLGLASGGGQQMPIFSALKADCTVLDYSKKQLESERIVAEREGYSINILEYDMTRLLPFEDDSFDIIFHPVSNCYVEEVGIIFRECFRILKQGGILVSGLDNGVNFITNDETIIENTLPFNPLINRNQMELLEKDDDGVQFSHTLEDQIGGQLKAGFVLTDIYEDTNGSGRLHNLNIPSFLATRCVKP